MTVRIILGDCRKALRSLADCSVHTAVTSPPYYGLRDYRVDGQLGHEPTPEKYVETLVDVFRDVRRVLRDDGTLWLNLGDSYAASGRGGNPVDSSHQKQATNRGSRAFFHAGAVDQGAIGRKWVKPPEGYKAKDLIGIPWMVAFALRNDGWYLRQDIIWSKPIPMPESVTDRCTKSHEYLFLLSKARTYYFDNVAFKEPASQNPITVSRNERADKGVVGSSALHGTEFGQSGNGGFDRGSISLRNRRSVWTIPLSPYRGAHFATFPPDLIEPCIIAGSPKGGVVLDPFGGAGTTGLVAKNLGRNAVLCELNDEYVAMAAERIGGALGLGITREVAQ